jgi:hypothetical protein
LAFNEYTYTALQLAVKAALGRDAHANTSNGEIVNDALDELANAHDWTWRKTIALRSFVSSQSYVALPTDFDHLLSLQSTAAGRCFEPTTLDEIIALRGSTATLGGSLYKYHVSWTPQATVAAAPIARVELYPTPSASTADAFRIAYRRIVSKLSGGTDLPDIPSNLCSMLRTLCKARALEDEREEFGNVYRLRFTNELRRAIERDGKSQAVVGSLRSQLPVAENAGLPADLYPYGGFTP